MIHIKQKEGDKFPPAFHLPSTLKKDTAYSIEATCVLFSFSHYIYNVMAGAT